LHGTKDGQYLLFHRKAQRDVKAHESAYAKRSCFNNRVPTQIRPECGGHHPKDQPKQQNQWAMEVMPSYASSSQNQ
jgi:hypothetical protein